MTQPAGPTALALESDVERAGLAMACSFSSSEELYAAMIEARRSAGMYRRSYVRHYFAVGAGVVALLAAIIVVF